MRRARTALIWTLRGSNGKRPLVLPCGRPVAALWPQGLTSHQILKVNTWQAGLFSLVCKTLSGPEVSCPPPRPFSL